MFKFVWLSVLLLLLQGCEGKIDSKSSDENAPSAVKDDTRTPSQPVDNTPLIINGHILPPEPDPSINSATLLGVDSNHNDVRDDVERWIYMTYDNSIVIGLLMQNARAYQKVIEDPSKAHETTKFIDESHSCKRYWLRHDSNLHKKYEYKNIKKELEHLEFNTIKRHIAYQRFNAAFSGQVFSSPKASKEACIFDKNGSLKLLK